MGNILYKKLNGNDDFEALLRDLEYEFRGKIPSFLKEENLVVKGIFYEEYEYNPDDDFEHIFRDIWFEFGRTITPDEVEAPEGTIFESLKLYGSSKTYSGLLSSNGKELIPNIYNSIEYIGEGVFKVEKTHLNVYAMKAGMFSLFGAIDINGKRIIPDIYSSIEYMGEGLFRVGKVGKSTLFGIVNIEGETVCGLQYDVICNLSEHTIGVVKDGKMGYIDCKGNVVIPLEYLYWKRNTNVFADGKVLVAKAQEDEDCAWVYEIDHYNNMIYRGFVGEKDLCGNEIHYDYPEGSTAGQIDDGYDILDAYEGDASNMWNTD